MGTPDLGAPVSWPARSCALTLRYEAPQGTQEVFVAGEFTGWADAPLPMQDLDGDGIFEVELTPQMGLMPGPQYAYKLIVDGDWRLDPASGRRKYDGACLNSSLVMPTCDRPEVKAQPWSVQVDGAAGSAQTRVQVFAAADSDPIDAVELSLDGAPLPASMWQQNLDGAIDLSLSALSIGKHTVVVSARDAQGRESEPLHLPFWVESEPFTWRDATMYMLVIDRFANGDTASDAPVGVEHPADWHGGDLWGALEVMRSDYFESMGVNAIWISPVNEQTDGAFLGRGGDQHMYTGYHGYWPISGRRVEPRFGGDEALTAFVEEAHRRGIRVLLDLINNQVHQEHEYFSANPDWFRTGCVCGIDAGCGWSERPLDCLFASYLPDINWRSEGAEERFTQDALFWLERFGIDGYRVDAVKHVETNSIYNTRAALAERFEQGGLRVFMNGETAVSEFDSVDYGCGEFYGDGYAWIDGYTGPQALDGQFDFPTHHRTADGLLNGGMSFNDVEQAIQDAQNRYRPEGVHVRFLGTHDAARIATRASTDPGKSCCQWANEGCGGACGQMPSVDPNEETYRRLRRAFTVLMTMPGIPLIYYGDEIALPGGGDPDNRRDMVWTQPLSALAMSGTTLTPQQDGLQTWVRALGQVRRQSPALGQGQRIPLIVEPDVYVFAWTLAGAQPALVVVSRGAAITDRMVTGLDLSNTQRFSTRVGDGQAVKVGQGVSVSVAAGEAAVFLGE